MGNVISALVYTIIDQAGNPRTEAWFTLEFSGAYATGGQFFDLSPYYKFIEHASVFPMSGMECRTPISASATIEIASGSRMNITPVVTDFANPISARFLIGAPAQLSGVGKEVSDILSGLATAVSGIRFGAKVLGY